jgi:hypothetical protein
MKTMIIEFPASQLLSAIKTVKSHMSSDDTRPHIACIRLTMERGCLTASATDGHRLVSVLLESGIDDAADETLVPHHAVPRLMELCELAIKKSIPLVYRDTDVPGLVTWKAGDMLAPYQLVDASFPHTESLFILDHQRAVAHVRPDDLKKLRTAIRGHKTVAIRAQDGALIADMLGPDLRTENKLVCTPAQITLEPKKPEPVGIKGSYFSDMIKAAIDLAGGQPVALTMGSEFDPIIFNAAKGRGVCMPVRL